MTDRRVYLDWNATAPLRPEARAAVIAALDEIGNPSSAHAEGRNARAIVETARQQVAALVNARPEDVVFTSGATEANALALGGRDWIAAAGVEHVSVLEQVGAGEGTLIDLPVNGVGLIEHGTLTAALSDVVQGHRGIAAVQLANNETGVVQAVAEIAAEAMQAGVSLHCDAVQAVGRTEVDFADLGASSMSLSAHKLGGPKGIGALVVRGGHQIEPMLRGGGQERRRRAGTEAVAAIAGFGAAAQAAKSELGRMAQVMRLRDRLETGILAFRPDAVVVSRDAVRLPNTTCVALPGRRSETLVIGLDLAGVSIGAGAACSSGKMSSSQVLAAMGLGPQVAQSAIRISIGATTTDEDIDACLEALRHAVTSAVAA